MSGDVTPKSVVLPVPRRWTGCCYPPISEVCAAAQGLVLAHDRILDHYHWWETVAPFSIS